MSEPAPIVVENVGEKVPDKAPEKPPEKAAEAPKPAEKSAEKPVDVPRSAIELRLARRRILIRRYGIFVGVPTLLAIIYYLAFATAQYDARITLAVESAEGRITGEKATNAGNQRDAQLLRTALLGDKALAALDQGNAFREHYAANGNWFSALADDAGESARREYYKDKVTALQDTGTNNVRVRVRAFSGKAAHDFAARLVDFAGTWVTEQNTATSTSRLELSTADVEKARKRLAELSGSPPSIDLQIAQKRLDAALEAEQQAQLELGRTERRLVVLDGPSTPDAPTLPRRVWSIVTVLVGALLLVSVVSLLGSAIREHARF